jgi:HEAT repeat protein
MDLGNAARKATKEELVAALPSAKTPKSQTPIVEGLGKFMDDSLVATVEPFITSTDYSLKRAAQFALGSKGNEAGLAKLVALLDNHDQTDTVHGDVPEILSRHPQSATVKGALPKLKKMAADDAQGVGRKEAVKAVVAIEGEAAIPFLAERAEKEKWESARLAIAKELAKFAKDPKAQAALKKLSEDKDAMVQKAAKEALAK